MKIIVAKPDLENALAVARLAVASGASDLSSHYLFRVVDDQVEILAYDQRVFARAPITAAEVEGEGDGFTVEARRLDLWMNGVSGAKALTLEALDNGEVALTGDRTKIRLRSLDPTKFPYWDELLSGAEDVGTIDPTSLARALGCSRWFVSDDDTSKPELCQVEAVDGVLWATDRRALSSVEMPRLPGLSVRIPGKDVAVLLRFLSSTEGSIKIQEAERAFEDGGGACAVFGREDGSYFGVTRPTSNFPTLNVDREEADEATIRINREEFNNALNVLLAGAPKDHEVVTFAYDQEEKTVRLVMPCEAGDVDDYTLMDVEVDKGENWDTEFTIDFTYLKGIADTFSLDTVELGINKRGRGGYVTFRHADEAEDDKGNQYYSVIVWRK